MTDEASFKRIAMPRNNRSIVIEDSDIIVEHKDGTLTVFGSDAVYEIFKRGLDFTNYSLWDDVNGAWIKP